MVCKRSLYCWKNGPCASDETRKQIWEDNIRFREMLQSMNQSDHYWSFQISNNNNNNHHGHRAYEEDYALRRPVLNRKYLSGSLQRLDRIDCASTTHDIEPKRRDWKRSSNSEIICPLHLCTEDVRLNAANARSMDDYIKEKSPLAIDYPLPSILKQNKADKCPLIPCDVGKVKLIEDLPKYCPRYKNTLTSVPLKSNVKYSSQPCLLSDKKRRVQIRRNFPSNEEIQQNNAAKPVSTLEQSPKKKIFEVKRNKIETKTELKSEKLPNETRTNVPDNSDQDSVHSRKVKLPSRDIYTPISRTTRKMLDSDNKRVPFVTFGCNNQNSDVGSKRTHNVFAAEHEVFPNALSAKQQRQEMILKFLKTEKELQKSLLPDDFKKKLVNHSSVWASEYNRKYKDNNSDTLFNKNKATKKIPPLGDKRLKSHSLVNRETKALPPCKYYKRPNSQAYFY